MKLKVLEHQESPPVSFSSNKAVQEYLKHEDSKADVKKTIGVFFKKSELSDCFHLDSLQMTHKSLNELSTKMMTLEEAFESLVMKVDRIFKTEFSHES